MADITKIKKINHVIYNCYLFNSLEIVETIGRLRKAYGDGRLSGRFRDYLFKELSLIR